MAWVVGSYSARFRGRRALIQNDGSTADAIPFVAIADSTGAIIETFGSADGATEGTLLALLAELELKADLTESQPVTGSVTVSGSVTADTELPAAASLTDAMANPTAPSVRSNLMLWNGATWTRARSGAGTVGTGTQRTVQGSDEAVYPTPGTVAFGSLSTSFTTLLTLSAECTEIHVYNGTDVVLELSFDGGTTHHAYIAPWESRTWAYRPMNRKESNTVAVSEVTGGDAATLGAVYADAVQ